MIARLPKPPARFALVALYLGVLVSCAMPAMHRQPPSSAGGVEPSLGDHSPVSSTNRNVAVLLPQRGYFASAAQAVQDGLRAAQRADAPDTRLRLRFYDASETANARALLQRAADAGAAMAIGPIQRAAVSRLAEAEQLPLTTLALNDVPSSGLPPPELYRFALSPEDEAAEVARIARAQGHSSALVIYPADQWGERLARAFITNWQARGGTIEAGQTYDPDTYALHAALARLFQTQQLATGPNGLGTGADCLFFVGSAQAAQALIPPIRAASANALPLFTTSHLYAAGPTALRASGLAGISFVDIPWIVAPEEQPSALRAAARDAGTRNLDRQRLFAMGLDAYRLARRLLAAPSAAARLDGATGALSIGSDRRIHRQLRLVRTGPQGLSVQR